MLFIAIEDEKTGESKVIPKPNNCSQCFIIPVSHGLTDFPYVCGTRLK